MQKYKYLITSMAFIGLLSGCGTHVNNYFSGIVIDEFNQPIPGVLIQEGLSEKYAGKTRTDSKGYFKLKRYSLLGLIIAKQGYISDTVKLVETQHGESLLYSPLITMDSSRHMLRAKNGKKLTFLYKKIENIPLLDTFIHPKFKEDLLFGTWMIDPDNGFILDKKYYYALGFDGLRYMRYNLTYDTLTIYNMDIYNYRKGIIKRLWSDSLEILWNKKELSKYRRRR